jgi:hypothetical protein
LARLFADLEFCLVRNRAAHGRGAVERQARALGIDGSTLRRWRRGAGDPSTNNCLALRDFVITGQPIRI